MQDFTLHSEELAASSSITGQSGLLYGIVVMTDGDHPVTLNVYDNPSAASGIKMFPEWVTSSLVQAFSLDPPARFLDGLYVDLTCAGSYKYMVYYVNR